MTTLSYPHTLVAGQPENINDVTDNFSAVTTWANGNVDTTNLAATAKPATLMGRYQTVSEVTTFFTSGASSGSYTVDGGGAPVKVAVNTQSLALVPINLPDYAVSGLTTQFRVQASTICNTIAPAANFTYSLALVNSLAGTASSIQIATIGALLGSVTRTTPSAATNYTDTGADFTVSASNNYVLVIGLSATPAANSIATSTVRLQVHNIA